jgi:hypothetical protein
MIMTGHSTGCGPASFSDSFSLSRHYKTLLFVGVAEVVAFTGSQYVSVGVSDSESASPPVAEPDRNRSGFNTIVASHQPSGPAAPLQRDSESCVTLDATMLGTALSGSGMFDKLLLKQDASAPVVPVSTDAVTGSAMGANRATGPASDNLAHIDLVGASTYTITLDEAAIGSITLHFSGGSQDLSCLQALPHKLFS